MGDYLGLHWQFGVVQNAVASVSAPSTMTIHESDGGTVNQITLAMGGSTATLAASASLSVPNGVTITIRAYSGYSGDAPTSYSWSLVETSDVNNISFLSTGTTNGTDYTDATVAISGSRGQAAGFRLVLTGTNSGGSTASSNFDFGLGVA